MAEEIKCDSTEFIKFYKAVANIDPEVKKQIRKHLMQAAKPIVQDVKNTVLALPSNRSVTGTRKKKGESLGLRASIANAAKADFNGTGRGAVAHIRISTSKFMSASGRSRTLPYYLEGRRKRAWRHPVFGNREVWTAQDPKPYLASTVFKHRDEFEKAVSEAVDQALQVIDQKVD